MAPRSRCRSRWRGADRLVLGTLLGMFGGYYGGVTDNVIMRFMDILLAFPGIFLAISIIAVLGPGLLNLMLAAGSTPCRSLPASCAAPSSA